MGGHITFWMVQLFFLNALSVFIYLFFMPSFFPGAWWALLAFVVAFFIQFPYIWCLGIVHWGLRWLSKKVRSGKVILTSLVTITEFFFLAAYLASQWFFFRFHTFASLEAVLIVFTDTVQIFFILFNGHGIELAGIAVFSIGLSLAYWKYVPAPGSRRVRRHSIALAAISLLCCCIALYCMGSAVALPKNIRVAIATKTFPTVYALPMPCRADATAIDTGKGIIETYPLQASSLPLVFNMDGYIKGNSPLVEKPPVFIVLLEAVSSDHVGFNGYRRRDISPNIDALAAESLAFINVYTASNHSNYAQTSFHSSQYARRRTFLDTFKYIDYPITLLSDIVGAYGYQTAFISAQNEDWQGMKAFTLHDSVFDHYYHAKSALGEGIAAERKIDDTLVVDEAIRTLGRFDLARPVYMYLNFQRTHFPYRLPPGAPMPYTPHELTEAVSFFNYPPRLINTMINRFDNALRYDDQELGRFFDFLREKGIYERAIIVVTADHGEAFYEKGYPTHGTSLFDDQVKTFLLIKMPYGRLKGLRRDAVSLLDVNPSILEVLNLRNHPNFQGRQIIKKNDEGRCIFITSQGVIHADGVVQYPWKFIISQKDGMRLVNLELDPTEKNDYSKAFPDKRNELEEALARHIAYQLQYYNILSTEQRSRFYPPSF